MRYLFFDIEGANNYNYIAKMCTFGYVITDDKFKLNTKIDVIIKEYNDNKTKKKKERGS